MGLLRLWGQAKIKRQYTGLVLNPTKLAAVMEYPGDEALLWQTMTDPAAPWLDGAEDGTWSLHGYAEHQAQIIRLWEIGRKGGRPKATTPSPIPPSLNTSSSSSSSPICEPNGNHMVFQTPTLEEFIEAGRQAGIEREIAEEIWHDNESRPIAPDGRWTDYRGNPIAKWQANMSARALQMKSRRGGIITKTHNGAKGKSDTPWEIKTRLEAISREIEAIRADRRNRIPNPEMPWESTMAPEAQAKVKALKATAQELNRKLALSAKEVA
ncbi:MAG: hypothetical protein ACO3PN_08970 [Chthoniobacterales bacterium]